MSRKDRNDESIPLLHVYGQSAWHDDVFIVGNRQALKALREAIGKALEQGQGETNDVFVADGEGYGVAEKLYGDPDERGKVTRLARSLRRLGFAVFGFGGMYYLGTETILEMAVVRYSKVGCGFYLGGLEALKNLAEKDPNRARELLKLIRGQANEVLRKLKI